MPRQSNKKSKFLCTALIVLAVLIQPSVSTAGPDVLFVDNFTRGAYQPNLFNGWTGAGDAGVSLTNFVFAGENNNVLKIRSTSNDGWYASVLHADGWANLNVSEYTYISFRIRGDVGQESLNFELQQSQQVKKSVPVSNYVTVLPYWQWVDIPLNDFTNFNHTLLHAIALTFPKNQIFYIDDIQFRKSHSPANFSFDFSSDVQSGTAPLQVNFQEESVSYNGTFLWNFGDGTTSAERNPTHVYTQAGQYSVTLTVKNPINQNVTLTKTNFIDVLENKSTLTFHADQRSALFSATISSLDVQFSANLSDKTISSYLWSFGDGTFSAAAQPVHTYQNIGNYDVTLTVTTTDNQTYELSKARYIRIFPEPNIHTADFDFSGEISIADLAILAGNWRRSCCQTIFNGDASRSLDIIQFGEAKGEISISDLAILAQDWKKTYKNALQDTTVVNHQGKKIAEYLPQGGQYVKRLFTYPDQPETSFDNQFMTTEDVLAGAVIKPGDALVQVPDRAINFIYQQMDLYKQGNNLRFAESYVNTDTFVFGDNPNTPEVEQYVARSYGNALAILALLARGYPEDLARARILAYSFVWVQEHDQSFDDGRVRDEYWSTSIASPSGLTSAIKSPGTTTGNLSWVMLALLNYYQVDDSNRAILDAVIKMGDFLEQHYRADSVFGSAHPGFGFVGGYNSTWENPITKEQELNTWKSVEHNSTAYAAFTLLYKLTNDPRWKENALWAKRFVLNSGVWNDVDKHFLVGTGNDGITLNTGAVALDANSITLLAFGSLGALDESIPWIMDSFALESDGFSGFDFNDNKDGVWFKGTGQMASVFNVLGMRDQAEFYLDEINRAQDEAGRPEDRGDGIMIASHDHVDSGFGYDYFAAQNISNTNWYIIARMHKHPYFLTDIREGVLSFEGSIKGQTSFVSSTITVRVYQAGTNTLVPGYQPFADQNKSLTGVQTQTDTAGRFQIYEIPAGTYDVLVTAPGSSVRRNGIEIKEWAQPVDVVF